MALGGAPVAYSEPNEVETPQRAVDMRIVGREDGHPLRGGRWCLHAFVFGASRVTSAIVRRHLGKITHD